MKKLTPKQLKFCQNYLIDQNATQAAIKAGYKEKTAQQAGSRLLSKVVVKEFLSKKAEKIAGKADLTAERVLRHLEEVREKCMEPEPVLINGDPTSEYKFNSQGALKALELQGKYLKMFTDKHEITGPKGGPLETNFTVQFIPSKQKD